MPRRYGCKYKDLNFIVLKENGRYVAFCNYCRKKVANTATQRLESHRKLCKEKANDTPVSSQVVQDTIETQIISPVLNPHYSANHTFAPISTVEQEEMEIFGEIVVDESGRQVDETHITTFNSSSLHDVSNSSEHIVENSTGYPLQWMMDGMVKKSNTLTNSFGIDNTLSATSSSSLPSHTVRKKTYQSERRNKSIESYVDKVTAEEIQELNSQMSNFFFGCNIPFSVIDSDHFKSFVKALRPSFGEHLLGRKALSTTLLDKKYEECIEICNKNVEPDSVLLIDGWKNTSNNTKTVVTLLHNASSSQAFLNAWDLSGEQETGDKLSSIVNESIAKAKSLYDTSVYAVVSDNASNMLRMARTVPIWHSNCSSHVGNLLAKDVMDEDITKKVQIILKEFKHTDFEKALLDHGGSRIKTPCETRWCSYRDSYECLISNIKYMKNLIVNDARFKKVKPSTVTLLFDDYFIHEVKENIKLFDPICNLLNICQNPNTSIADSAHLWLNLKLPGNFLSQLQHRQNMALNVYSLSAYTLHPKYCDEAQVLLSQERLEMVQDFLIGELSYPGVESLGEFKKKKGIFQVLFTKVPENAILFWEMAIIHHKELSTLSLKLLKIPASSAQIERVFSNWSYVHSPIRNRLDFNRSTKLLHIYYTLKIKDANKSDEY